ncbi:hypothetical protein CU097_005535 [Rhizopus azygosporus]|uniref:Uncharacterized protein n=1 Tax=Rhizopus azygosporus TaxID=86630 RepID=A0A367J8A7_RHIAZ|nr:hypothetical protein CU097_005535 [Rhizopus azygosporus]
MVCPKVLFSSGTHAFIIIEAKYDLHWKTRDRLSIKSIHAIWTTSQDHQDIYFSRQKRDRLQNGVLTEKRFVQNTSAQHLQQYMT